MARDTPTGAVDLRAEARLSPEIASTPMPPADPLTSVNPRRVLLTGATGFLGAYLLRALLDRSRAEVCLT